MTGIQEKLLEALSWLHQFCKEHDIQYYATAGTFLGAVRHNGFIPWDDDIDICMPRKDYNKFIKLMEDASGRYRIETPYSTSPDFCYTNTKLYDTETTAVEVTKYNCKRGIFIDIFPLDGIGNTEEEVNKNYKKIYYLNMFRAARTCEINSLRKWYKNLAIVIASLIPNFLVDNKNILIKLDKLCAEHDFDTCKYGGVLLTAYGKKFIMDTNIYKKTSVYQFENTVIQGVKDYESYLTLLYDDWRKLPPENKRVSGHTFSLLDLERSYLQ